MALSERDQRTLRIGGIAVGVLIVGFLLLKVLGGGGGEEATSPPVFPTSPGPSVSPSVVPSPGPQVVLVFSGRDPFSPPPALANPTGSATPSATPTSPTPTSHALFLASTIVDGKTFALVRTYVDGSVRRADVVFDSRSFTGLQAGDDVGGVVQVTSIDGGCATFRSADGTFTLCVSG